uniref:sugar phosphate nucleotidyltransferase n=1 Tax=Desulfonatronum thioautotrophicum TaxID=617001 RepID=UPI0005EB575A
MKALILAAGAGKRLRAQTKEQNKCMLEFLSKPLIEHSLNTAASLDEIDEIVIVVGHMAEQIINTYGTSYQGKKIKYKIQSPLKGVVAAIEAAKPYLDGEEF